MTWTFAGRYFLTSAPSVLVGLAVTSHNDGTLCTAQFDNVSLFDAPAVATNLRVTHRGENGRIDLAWNDNSSDETGFVIEMADGDDQSTGGFAPVGRVGPNVTQYTAANLGLGWAYDFQVRAVKGEVGNVGEHLVVRTTVPPSGLMVTGTQATAVSLRFYASPGGERFPSRSASGYSLERSVDNATFVEIANNLSSDDNRNVFYTDTGVAAGTTYFYRARYRASNGDVSSYTSVVTTTTPGTGGIAAPTGLTATALSSTEIRLNWTDNARNETDYQIERSADGVSFAMVSSGGGANQVTRTESGLTPNTTYHYRVRAVNGSAASGYSNVANATTQSTSTVPPAAPSNLVATALSSTEVRLTWTDNSTDETGFTITRSTDGVHWGDALSAGANATSVNDPGRTPGLRYYYRIRAQRQSSAGTTFSSFSNETNVLMPGTPPDTGAWTSTDVGVVGAAGRTAQNGETFVVSGSGHDIWETQDAFHFYARPLTGNGEIYARISALDRTDGWAKAGVMLRTSTEPGAPYAFIFVNPDFTLAWQHREATGGATSFDGRYAWGPIWLRIVRSAGSLLLYYSFDKNRWELVKTVTFQMPTTILAGLAVTSHNRGTLANATFDSLVVHQYDQTTPPPSPTPPAAPTNLNATAAAREVRLNWTDASQDETGFEVWRAVGAAQSDSIARVAAGVTTFTDMNVEPERSYTYTVRALNAAGPSAMSNSVQVTTPALEPHAAWNGTQIGGLPGAFTSDSSGTITVRGTGEDIWGTTDEFFFVHQPLSGNGEMVARVQSLQHTHDWAKAGVMIRDTLGVQAKHAFALLTPQIGAYGHSRSQTGGETSLAQGPWWASAPYWVKLVRAGNVFSAYASPDRSTWSLMANTTIEMGTEVYVGLAVTSHTRGATATAVFDNVQVIRR